MGEQHLYAAMEPALSATLQYSKFPPVDGNLHDGEYRSIVFGTLREQ